jgi:hypothetical protein
MVKSNPLGHMGSNMQRKGKGGGMDFRDLKTFDLSHKGGFIQIITSKNIFKIFQAKIGHNASFTWRSIYNNNSRTIRIWDSFPTPSTFK